jgi:hypothetical protein
VCVRVFVCVLVCVLCVRLYVCGCMYVFLAHAQERALSLHARACITRAHTHTQAHRHTQTHTDTHLFKIGREFVFKCPGEQVCVWDNLLVCRV